MNFTKKFILFSILNLIILYIAKNLLSGYVVFGNIIIPETQSIITISIGLALIISSLHLIAQDIALTVSQNTWKIIYFIGNIVLVYLAARTPLSKALAFGLINYWVAIFLGLVIGLVQFTCWNLLEKSK